MTSDEKQWSSIREAFVYWANKRKANSVRSYASVRESILALANNESKSNGGGGGDLGGLFTIVYTTDADEQQIIDYVIGNEEFLWSKDIKILTEEAAELFNSTRYTEDPYVLQDGDIINITDLLRHLILEDVTPEPEESDDDSEESDDEPITRVLRIKTQDVEGFYSNGFISARGVDNTASSGGGGIDEDELWDILEAVGEGEQINLSHLTNLQTWVTNNFYARNGQDHLITESDLLNNYTIWGQRFQSDSGDLTKKIITGNMSNVGNITMSGNITMNGSIYMGANHNVILSAITNYLNSNVGFYSSSFISARGVDPTVASGSSDFDVDEMWDELATNDATHKIHNSHLNDDIVTTTVLNNRLLNYLDIPGLQAELNNYTIWGQHFVNKVISGNISNVGNVSMNGNIDYVTNLYFNNTKTVYLAADNSALKSNSGLYSLSYLSVRGSDSTAASSGDFDEDSMWDALATNDSTKLIHSSHITGFITQSQLDQAIANMVTTVTLPTILQTYTVWGRPLTSVTNGDMTGVGNISMSGNITMTSNNGTISGLSALRFGSDSSKSLSLISSYINSSVGLYSNSFISARGVDSSIFTDQFDESDMWDLLSNTSSGHTINANLIPIGNGLSVSNGVIVATGGTGLTLTEVWQSLKGNTDLYANEKINVSHFSLGNGLTTATVNNVTKIVARLGQGLEFSSSAIAVNNTVVRTEYTGGIKIWLGTTSALSQISPRDPNTLYFEMSDNISS